MYYCEPTIQLMPQYRGGRDFESRLVEWVRYPEKKKTYIVQSPVRGAPSTHVGMAIMHVRVAAAAPRNSKPLLVFVLQHNCATKGTRRQHPQIFPGAWYLVCLSPRKLPKQPFVPHGMDDSSLPLKGFQQGTLWGPNSL